MSEIQYLPLNSVDIEDLLTLMNKHKTRRHLMNYPVFDLESIQAWVDACLLYTSPSPRDS